MIRHVRQVVLMLALYFKFQGSILKIGVVNFFPYSNWVSDPFSNSSLLIIFQYTAFIIFWPAVPGVLMLWCLWIAGGKKMFTTF